MKQINHQLTEPFIIINFVWSEISVLQYQGHKGISPIYSPFVCLSLLNC